MSVNTFDVDPVMIRADYYSMLSEFSLHSTPTKETVERWIDQEAAGLEGKLRREKITASSITDAESSAFLWCQKTLSLMVALRPGWPQAAVVPEAVRENWEAELKQRLEDLGEDGVLALGGSLPVPATSPNGPRTHLSSYGIDVGDLAGDASSSAPPFRLRDKL